MCTDLHDLTLQVNINPTGKFITSHITFIAYLVMLTSVKSCRLPTKIFINILRKENSSCKFIREILNNNSTCHGLDHLIKKIDQSDSLT